MILLLTSRLRAHHAPEHPVHVRSLARAMRRDGWRGRPLLVEPLPHTRDGRVQAWTGSHRLPAARRAHVLSVPVRYIDRERVTTHMIRCGFTPGDVLLLGLPDGWHDGDRAAFLDDAGDVMSAALLRMETTENVREDRVAAWDKRPKRPGFSVRRGAPACFALPTDPLAGYTQE